MRAVPRPRDGGRRNESMRRAKSIYISSARNGVSSDCQTDDLGFGAFSDWCRVAVTM